MGNCGNEVADRLAKEATKNKETIYKKIPKSQIVQQVKQQSIEKCKPNGNKQLKDEKQNSFSQTLRKD